MPYAPKSHDLTFLASRIPLELTEEQEELLSIITRFNIDGRYDDYKNNFYNLCTEEYTKNSIEKIKSLRVWLMDILKNESEENECEKE